METYFPIPATERHTLRIGFLDNNPKWILGMAKPSLNVSIVSKELVLPAF